jgi:cAMP-dependent protein kinase regulator
MAMVDVRALKDRAAQYITRGRPDLALAEYTKVVLAQPTDIVTRQKVAELYQRLGRREDAVREYQHVAGRYAVDGQLLKAIAICKNILNLEPTHTATQKILADLYARHRGPSQKITLPSFMTGSVQAALPAAARQAAEPAVSGEDALMAPPVPTEDWLERTGGAAREDSLEIEVEEAPASEEISLKRDTLPRIPLFSSLQRSAFLTLSDELTMRSATRGEALVNEGETGKSMFIVVQGSVDVQRMQADGQSRVVAHMGEGSFFGEMALVAELPRMATVVMAEDGVVFEITRDKVREMVKEHPSMAGVIEQFYRERLLANLLRSSPLFRTLPPDAQATLAAVFKTRSVESRVVLIQQGQQGPGFHVLLRGRCMVRHTTTTGKTQRLPDLREGDVFGEISLMAKVPATATVETAGACVVMRLQPEAFDGLLARYPTVRLAVSNLGRERLQRTADLENEARAQVPHRI